MLNHEQILQGLEKEEVEGKHGAYLRLTRNSKENQEVLSQETKIPQRDVRITSMEDMYNSVGSEHDSLFEDDAFADFLPGGHPSHTPKKN